MIRNKGATSQSIYVVILDSTSTTGGRKTGLAFNTAGLTAYYVRQGGSATAITLATLAAANSAWSSGGFKEVDATNMPGVYRLDIPDAALATGADSVIVTLKGATGMVQVDKEIELTSVNLQDAVRGGMTALPNANAEAAGGLYTRGTGAGQINQPANGLIDANTLRWNGTAVATPATAGIPDVNVKNMNNVSAASITTINANQGTTQPVNYTGTGASALVKGDAIDLAGQAITAASGVTFPSSVASPTNITAGTITTATNLTNAPTNGDFTAAMKTSLNNATPSVTVSDKTGFSLSAAGIQAIWDRLTSALTTVGSIGKLLVDNIDAAISSRSTYAGGAVASVTGNVGGNVTGSVGSVASGGITAASFGAGAIDNAAIAADAIGSSELAASAVNEIADQVWDELIAGHLGAGSTGAALNAAGSAGDPWTTPLPGAYGAGTAGNIVGNNLDAAVSSRLASGGYTTPPTVTQIRTEMDTNSSKLDVAVSTRLASASYTTPPTAVQNRQEMDSNSTKLANLDATISSRSTLTAANVWAYVIEGTLTAERFMRLILASVANKLSGAATTTVHIRDVGDTKDRIVATVDVDGNRSAVTLDGS